MSPFLTEYWSNVEATITASAAIAFFAFAWQNIKLLKKHSLILEKHSDFLKEISSEFKGTIERVNIHDQMFSNLMGKGFDFERIAKGFSSIPDKACQYFGPDKKLRES